VERTAVNRALVYVITAIVLGLAMTLVPTWLFLVNADQHGKPGMWGASLQFRSEASIPPLLKEQNNNGTVSSKEMEVLSISFIVASIVYIAFKRKIPRRDYIWPPMRPY
jgi:hypothetical protein